MPNELTDLCRKLIDWDRNSSIWPNPNGTARLLNEAVIMARDALPEYRGTVLPNDVTGAVEVATCRTT